MEPGGRFREPFPILYADDVQGLRDFYCTGFGFEARYQYPTDGPPEYAFLRLDPLGIGLVDRHAAASILARSLEAPDQPGFELCITSDDVDAACERLAALGVPILVQPANRPWGERLAYAQDPEGNPIQIIGPLRP
jgi:lactoylglutathione lyase